MSTVVHCTVEGCTGRVGMGDERGRAVYDVLERFHWDAAPARCVEHAENVHAVYQRMSEDDRREVVEYVIAAGRPLDAKDEWDNEDNYTTTEGLAEVYTRHIASHEVNGNPEAAKAVESCDMEPDCLSDEHYDNCATVRNFYDDEVYVNGSGDYCVHTEHGWQVVESGEMVVLFSPRNGRGGFDSQVSYQTPGHNAPWRVLDDESAALRARLVVEEFNESHAKAWARRAGRGVRA